MTYKSRILRTLKATIGKKPMSFEQLRAGVEPRNIDRFNDVLNELLEADKIRCNDACFWWRVS